MANTAALLVKNHSENQIFKRALSKEAITLLGRQRGEQLIGHYKRVFGWHEIPLTCPGAARKRRIVKLFRYRIPMA